MGEPSLRRFGFKPDPAEVLPPEVVAERCVHSLMEQATCRACVDACPRAAFVLDDERLGIDIARCDACGLCAAACPQGAVLGVFAPVTYRLGGEPIAFAACERALSAIGAPGILPCLHALGLSHLLALRREGVTRLMLSRGDCQACPRGSSTRIDSHLDAVRQILESRRLTPIVTVFLAPESWSRAHRAAARQPKPGLDRRAFFRQAIGSAVDQVVRRANGDAAPGGVPRGTPPGRYFPTTGPGQLVPFTPSIDEDRCTGCDACARLCPEGAIRVDADAYRLEADDCTGCRVCVDVCTQRAVTIKALAVPTRTEIALHGRRCRTCGVLFHTPKQGDGAGASRCPVCTASNHHRLLFQVLD